MNLKTLSLLSFIGMASISFAAIAQQAPTSNAPVPALRAPISTIDTHEGMIVDINIAPNMSMPRHQHPGDEFLYMLSGMVTLEQEGQEPKMLQAGDGYQIPAGTVHVPKGGPDGARAIVFRVHPSGESVTVLAEDE